MISRFHGSWVLSQDSTQSEKEGTELTRASLVCCDAAQEATFSIVVALPAMSSWATGRRRRRGPRGWWAPSSGAGAAADEPGATVPSSTAAGAGAAGAAAAAAAAVVAPECRSSPWMAFRKQNT